MLALYRAGLRLRRSAPWNEEATLGWLPTTGAVLAFSRGDLFTCIVNFGPELVELPAGASILLASSELEGGALPQDTTVWLLEPSGRKTAPEPPAHANDHEGKGVT
jgi:alpha-glucosidase